MLSGTAILKKSFNRYVNVLFGIAAPRHCEICGSFIGEQKTILEFICNDCLLNLPPAPPPDEIMNKLILNFEADELSISRAYCLFSVVRNFEIMEVIYSLKYRGFTRIGTEFGRELGSVVKKYRDISYDGIIPVPIHHARRRERGFNQSEIIARAVSEVLGCPVKTKVIKRKKYTPSQTTLSKSERRKNVDNIFVPFNSNEELYNLSFLLIDDVLTTGSTLNSLATSLLERGARRVDCAALAYA